MLWAIEGRAQASEDTTAMDDVMPHEKHDDRSHCIQTPSSSPVPESIASSPEYMSICNQGTVSKLLTPPSSVPTSPVSPHCVDGPAEQLLCMTASDKPKRTAGLHRSASSPSIVLHRKFSKMFTPGSVRHRPGEVVRPNLGCVVPEPQFRAAVRPATIRVVSTPTSVNGASSTVSPTETMSTDASFPKHSSSPLTLDSTDQATVVSESKAAFNCDKIHALTGTKCSSRDTGLNPTKLLKERGILPTIDEAIHSYAPADEAIILPKSIALVEKVAAVKVYLETHYDSENFHTVTPRSFRRRRMELALYASRRGPLECQHIREHFVKAESEHLREIRALKTHRTHEVRGIEIAGYESIRVLGKGSFGVVRLVRDKRGDQKTFCE